MRPEQTQIVDCAPDPIHSMSQVDDVLIPLPMQSVTIIKQPEIWVQSQCLLKFTYQLCLYLPSVRH
jgi:hypothetical protein